MPIKKKVMMCLAVTLVFGSMSFPTLTNSGGFKESTDRNTTFIDHSPYKLSDQKKALS
ncbi:MULTISPECIES: phosphatase RapH inhibitor PhrH [Bacillus]|uniref:phosphatase RapH inhibitor PhrH n=1 Tax=Bacillus TaxID=1386 RepID=UPI0001F5C267|nr:MULTISPECIES: phosphatase RapH inhibitor PhrH [Bacillus]ADV95671.1 putative inhibitor of regulatory cascade [Bacillus subtilis BSn5]KAA0931038.1 phosphatase RapH inhibitor PhrH [Bacillus sp. ANT_WA51]MBJ3804605.1 phosphatase RapH inhibitor PhrH [Bacillus subtilis]MBR0008755.1 phosphatase RapH inhibitor PhrH [Bacillus subtilis]MBR0018963.1 phosphatase RapH inhibitor PhrH [Bacillus subtilis]